MNWSPSHPNGWWPDLSPDGTKVAYGNAASYVQDLTNPAQESLQFFPDAPVARAWGGHWLSNTLLTFFREVSSGVWDRYLVDLSEGMFGVGPVLQTQGLTAVTAERMARGQTGQGLTASFFDARDGHWAANAPWLHTYYDGPAYQPAHGGHGVKVGGPYLLQLREGDQLARWDTRDDTVRMFAPKVGAHEFTINTEGWIGYGKSGPAHVIAPSGEDFDVTVTPWLTEGVPHVVMVEGVPWVWTATTRPDNGQPLVLGRVLGTPACLVLPMPGEVHLSVVHVDDRFVVAGCDAVGRMQVLDVSRFGERVALQPACKPFPKPIWFGHFFAFSDRPGYGSSPNYPQNITFVADAGAIAEAAAVCPIITSAGPDSQGRSNLHAVKAAGVQHRVKALWAAPADQNESEPGAVTAERMAQGQIRQWRELFTEPPPPVLYYVTPGEVSRADWSHAPSVGIYMPEFYFEWPADFNRLRELLWRKMGFWLQKLGTAKPWLPVFQAFDRSRPEVDMEAIAAMQPLFLRSLVDVDPRIGALPPALGAFFFAVNRPGGARDYPKIAAWHNAMFRSIPSGPLPAFPVGGGGGTTVIPKVTIVSYTPDHGEAPLRVKAVAAKEEGSGQVDRYLWLYRRVGEASWKLAADNAAADDDHTYELGAGEWELALQGKGPGGTVQTQRRRVVKVGGGTVPPPQPGLPGYETFVRVEAPEVQAAFHAKHGRQPTASDIAHFAWRRLVEGWTHEAILKDIAGEGPSDPNPKPPPPPPAGEVKPLRVRGKFLQTDDDGRIFRPLFVGGFALIPKPLGDVQAYLDWARATGFNGIRVMAGALTWAGQTAESARTQLQPLLAEASKRGLYVEVTAITDSATGYDVEDHLNRIGQLCVPYQNVLVEVANEPYHATQTPALHNFGFLQHLGQSYLDPHGLIWAPGAPDTDEPEDPLPGRYLTLHLDRGRDPWNMVRRVREMEVSQQRYGRFVMNNEPIGFADTDQPGRRTADPQIAFTMGVLSRGFEVGVVSHADHCLHAVAPSPRQQECHEALVAGFRCLPTQAELVYKNAGFHDSPIKGANFSRPDEGYVGTIVRAYSFLDSGSHGFSVLLGLTGDPGVEWQNGFEPRRTLEDRGGVRVLEVSR